MTSLEGFDDWIPSNGCLHSMACLYDIANWSLIGNARKSWVLRNARLCLVPYLNDVPNWSLISSTRKSWIPRIERLCLMACWKNVLNWSLICRTIKSWNTAKTGQSVEKYLFCFEKEGKGYGSRTRSAFYPLKGGVNLGIHEQL